MWQRDSVQVNEAAGHVENAHKTLQLSAVSEYPRINDSQLDLLERRRNTAGCFS
jgi:hypothetical protein